MRYYFGIYHWRRRFKRLAIAALAALAGVVTWRRARGPVGRLAAVALLAVGGQRARRPLRSMLTPPPWAVRRGKYRRLASQLTVPADGWLLDLGCGTGRSLVGLSDALPTGVSVVGLDVFDDRVILGNGPQLAARNAHTAGLDASILAGDAARLPIATDSMDAVTACRLLHDLPKPAAEHTLAEIHRVLHPGGQLGLLELPIPHDDAVDPADYWHDLLRAAGFDVDVRERAGVDDGYYVYTASPT